LLLVQGKLSNLTVEERFAFNVSLRMFTRSIVIKRRVEDLQLGVESYQKRLNLTKPDTDGTLNDVRNALDNRLKGIRMQYLPTTIWRRGDKDRAAAMIQAIDKMLKTRRIMRSLEKFVGGRLLKRKNQKEWTSVMAANLTIYIAKKRTLATLVDLACIHHSLETDYILTAFAVEVPMKLPIQFAHLEKKQTRPRLYTNYLEKNLTDRGDGVTNHTRRRHITKETASECSRLKETLEDSTGDRVRIIIQLRIILSVEDKLNYLEHPISAALVPAHAGVKNFVCSTSCAGTSSDYARISLLLARRRANYNMHSMGKTIKELHAMLKLHEQTLLKNNAHALHAIRSGKGLMGSRKLKPDALSLYVGNGQHAAVETDCKTTLKNLRTKFENAFNAEFKERMHKYTRFDAQSFKDAMISTMDSIRKYILEIILHQQRTSHLLKQKKLMQTQEDHSNPIRAMIVDSLKVDSVFIQNPCSETEDSNSETASSKSVKKSSLDSATKDVHAIKYKMSKAKERYMTYSLSLYSHLQVLSKEDLKGTRIEHGFTRAFMSLFGQEADTFTNADDADIRPIYDEEPMAKVQLTAECNIFAIGQQHTEQPKIINEGRVDQYPEQRHVKSPMFDSSLDNLTNDYSK
nr:zinc finger, CCHC-type [Tanacetum cinerariifolium]